MRIVLDTNVVVSMVLGTRGFRLLYEAFRAGMLEPVMTDAMLDELEDVLGRSHLKIDPDSREEFLTLLRQKAIRLSHPVPVVERSDPGDNAVLSAALTNQTILVTGDHQLQDLHPFRDVVPILSPSEFTRRFLQP